MARHSDPTSHTVASIRMVASDAITAAREIESLCEMLDEDGVFAIPVKFFETATKGNTHLRSFARSIREAMARYHASGEGVTRKNNAADAKMIREVSAELAAGKPKRKSQKKSG